MTQDSRARTMSRERWMAFGFALGSACFLIGPFPGFVQLVGDSADSITFFAGSILFTFGGAAHGLDEARTMTHWSGAPTGVGRSVSWSPGRSPTEPRHAGRRLLDLERELRTDL